MPKDKDTATPATDPKLDAFTAIVASLRLIESKADKFSVLSAAAQFHGFSLKPPE